MSYIIQGMQTDNAKREKASELIMGLEEGAIIGANTYIRKIYFRSRLSAVEADG
jgi:hypothetical protein